MPIASRPRIIPARAGFTPRVIVISRDSRDHPRSRGVYITTMTPCLGMRGSSPLARGLQGSGYLRIVREGIIPARAGFTAISGQNDPHKEDHPRSRGVYYHEIAHETADQGSSPLARGLLTPITHNAIIIRIIPARAGFTLFPFPRTAPDTDHPRSRGVYDNCVSAFPAS